MLAVSRVAAALERARQNGGGPVRLSVPDRSAHAAVRIAGPAIVAIVIVAGTALGAALATLVMRDQVAQILASRVPSIARAGVERVPTAP